MYAHHTQARRWITDILLLALMAVVLVALISLELNLVW
jgi:hypothetical protein